MNPNAMHDPVFQVMSGDQMVDLTQRFPGLADSIERGVRVASDPATCADFFKFKMDAFIEDLLGWDMEHGKSSHHGGVLGKMRAYYGTAEFTDRGQLHGHFLIWLEGGMNPSDVHRKMAEEPEWETVLRVL